MDMHRGVLGVAECRTSIHMTPDVYERRRQYRLIFIPSPLRCVLAFGTKHDTSNPSLLQPAYQRIYFSTPYYMVDLKNPYVLDIQKPNFVRCWDAFIFFLK